MESIELRNHEIPLETHYSTDLFPIDPVSLENLKKSQKPTERTKSRYR